MDWNVETGEEVNYVYLIHKQEGKYIKRKLFSLLQREKIVTLCIRDLGLTLEKDVRCLFLGHFEGRSSIRGILGSNRNWLVPKIKPTIQVRLV